MKRNECVCVCKCAANCAFKAGGETRSARVLCKANLPHCWQEVTLSCTCTPDPCLMYTIFNLYIMYNQHSHKHTHMCLNSVYTVHRDLLSDYYESDLNCRCARCVCLYNRTMSAITGLYREMNRCGFHVIEVDANTRVCVYFCEGVSSVAHNRKTGARSVCSCDMVCVISANWFGGGDVNGEMLYTKIAINLLQRTHRKPLPRITLRVCRLCS